MKDRNFIFTNPHAPVVGETPKTKRRKRAKLMFEEERREELDPATDPWLTDLLDQVAKRKIK